ncbi:MAG: hypothetical protein ACOYNS_00670 [Bacteroidota bacterium]
MGLGQTLLTIMGLILMGRLILSINRTTLDTGFTKDMAEYRITGTSLGTSMLEKASNLAFDEKSVDAAILVVSGFTVNGSLGKDAGETTEITFDDIDDYHNYVSVDTLSTSATFKSRVTVQYISVAANVISVSATQQYAKMLTVDVTSDYLIDYSVSPPRPDTLRFKEIFSYWYFR